MIMSTEKLKNELQITCSFMYSICRCSRSTVPLCNRNSAPHFIIGKNMASLASIETLPEDILFSVCRFLSFRDLLQVRRVSKGLRNAIYRFRPSADVEAPARDILAIQCILICLPLASISVRLPSSSDVNDEMYVFSTMWRSACLVGVFHFACTADCHWSAC
jgi:hypothetical protein